MPVDLLSERVLDLDGAVEFASKGKARPLHKSTIPRWMFRGVHGVRLEYARLGRRLVTSAEAIGRFAEALTAADQQALPASSVPRKAQSRPEDEIQEEQKGCGSQGI